MSTYICYSTSNHTHLCAKRSKRVKDNVMYVCVCVCVDPWDVTDTHPYHYTLTALDVWLQYPPTVSAETPSRTIIHCIVILVSARLCVCMGVHVCVHVCLCVCAYACVITYTLVVRLSCKNKTSNHRLYSRNRKLRLETCMIYLSSD